MSFPIVLMSDKVPIPLINGKEDPLCCMGPYYLKLRYHSSVKDYPENIPTIKDFDIFPCFLSLGEYFEDELYYRMGENPQLHEEYLCPYIPGGEPPMGDYFALWWFREDQIDDLVKIENDENLRIFPRYIHKISEFENIEQFCWENHLYLNHLIEQKKVAEENIEKFEEIAKQQNMSLKEYLKVNYDVATPKKVEFRIKQYVKNEEKRKVKIATNLIEILTAEPSPGDLPIFRLSSYEFLWKTPHPFEGNGVPESLINIDLAQFQKPNKIFAFDEIVGEVRGYFEKGYGLNFVNENYEAFIKEYIELAQSSFFSYALVCELKEDYLERLREHMYKEARLKAQHAFYREGPTWTITFDGKTLRGLKSKGFNYINYLIINKLESFSHAELDLLDGKPVIDIGPADIDLLADKSQNTIKGGQTTDHDVMIHGKSIPELKSEYKTVCIALNEAKRKRIPQEIDAAQNKYNEFHKLYYDYFTKHGRLKKFKSDQKNNRDRIAKNMKEAKDELKDNDPTHDKRIWKHFEDALGGLYGQSIAYRPSEDIDWHT